MAQRSNKRQPVYSADTLALRYLGGLALAALGAVMFLAVGAQLEGNVFDALRQVCYGLTGGLALPFSLLPVWAGVLVIWSSQRKAPVKPFAFAALGFLCLCGFIVLVTRIGGSGGLNGQEYLQVLKGESDGSWTGVIRQGYLRSLRWKAGGGALGTALAFPLWTLLGQILGAAILLVGTLVSVLLALNLTPSRIRSLASGREAFRVGRRRDEREQADRQQIAYQQEMERKRQADLARQQAYIVQQAQAARQGGAAPGGAGAFGIPQDAGAQVSGRGWTGTTPAVTRESVQEWQEQGQMKTAAAQTGRRSVIFEPRENPARTGDSRIFRAEPAGAPVPETGRKSRIFGRNRDGEDGLSSLSAEEKRSEGMAYPGSDRLKKARAERVNAGQEAEIPAPAAPDPRQAARKETAAERIRNRQAEVDEDLERRWGGGAAAGPEEIRTEEEARPEVRKETAAERIRNRQAEAGGNPESGRGRETAARAAGARAEEEPPWTMEESGAVRGRKAVSAGREPEIREAGEAPSRESGPKPTGSGGPERKAAPTGRVQVPVVQETIADPVWKPELKHVEPREKEPEEEYWEPTPYYAPPVTDLKKPEAAAMDTSREDAERSLRLEETLASFRVQARVVHVTHGPAISRFELELAPGTKVGKVAELEKDIAYGMQATSVRIEAPIPGKGLVGVEVPNPKRTTVTLREVLESPQMQNAKSILTVALGKDIAGTPVICDLAKMPHMLIAGATGSGKSVCINTIINSLLFRAGPEEVRMILVDPKVVELQCYNGIPHLLLPVVNDPHKASAALAWAVAEMMERYDKFSERGVRNLEGYNGILKPGEKPMPRIVIIIDELADLMMVCKKDVEEYICRLTQLARAAGIHLIVATQRPSVDVITGLIKANIPSRIAFKTASYVDSRTILDRNGSETLLGWGDMLYLPTGSFAPTRIQGCFLSDEEVNRIADHVRAANPSSYDPDILDKLEQLSRGQEEGPGMDMIGGPQDSGPGDTDLFEQAVEFAIADGQISTSTLQRRLKVGYARAGRLTDEMEERGIVSAKDGSKPRKCLITREEWERMKASGEAS